MTEREYLDDCRNELFCDIVEFRKLFGDRSLDEVMLLIEKRERELNGLASVVEKNKDSGVTFETIKGGIHSVKDLLKTELHVNGINEDYEIIAERLMEAKERITAICNALNDHAEALAYAEENTPMGRLEPSIKEYEITISTDEEPFGLNAYKNDVIKHAKDKRAKLEAIVQAAENLSPAKQETSGQHVKYM